MQPDGTACCKGLTGNLQLRRVLQEAEARGIFQQLILAVDYCHRMGVANRDIKLENVLLGGDKKTPVIKLTDFGFSKSDLDSIPTTICGTLGYMGELQGSFSTAVP